jgi:hypothetical protein
MHGLKPIRVLRLISEGSLSVLKGVVQMRRWLFVEQPPSHVQRICSFESPYA